MKGEEMGRGQGYLHPCCRRSDKKTQQVTESRNLQRKPRGAKATKAEDVLTIETVLRGWGHTAGWQGRCKPLAVAFSGLLCTQSPRALMKWQILIALVQGGA